MAFTKFTKDMAIIAKLDDEPNDVGGLTAAELKDKFDEGGKAIQDYLNETLAPELDTFDETNTEILATKVDKTTTVNGHPLSEDVTVTKADVGLGRVDNTPDAEKPISQAQQAALDEKADKTELQGVVLGQVPDGSITPEKMDPSFFSYIMDIQVTYNGGGAG